MRILADANLPALERFFPKPLILKPYQNEKQLKSLLQDADVLVCRSTLKVTKDLLDGSCLKAVATASSGIDHIDQQYLKQNGIHLFNAHGANAAAVADYVISTLAHLELQEKICGKNAGVIGCGKVGSQVIKRLQSLGFKVFCYDPIQAEKDSSLTFCSKEALLSCDLICIHANLHDTPPFPSRNLLDADFLSKLKPFTVMINAARGGIVDEKALVHTKTPLHYCTDVYENEPQPNEQIISFAELATPHIAGHSIEAKIRAVLQISEQIHGLLNCAPPPYRISDQQYGLPSTFDLWQHFILNLYNPLPETLALKTAHDKKNAFLNLRQAHVNRHDFAHYGNSALAPKLQEIIGFT